MRVNTFTATCERKNAEFLPPAQVCFKPFTARDFRSRLTSDNAEKH